MSRARAPHKRVLECLLERAMHLITHILNRATAPYNQRLTEIRHDALALGVNADQGKFLPAAVHDVLNAQVKLARHDDRVGFAGELVQMRDADGVDFVVDVQAFDVFAVVFHDGVDEVVYGGVFVAHENFAVEHFVVFEDIVDHFLVEVFGGCLEVDLHATGLFGLEVDVAVRLSISQSNVF
jgi:hypothetical protein